MCCVTIEKNDQEREKNGEKIRESVSSEDREKPRTGEEQGRETKGTPDGIQGTEQMGDPPSDNRHNP
ncbi:unnamed protein product [marine sediment metagenome]|uniref:Uncharacterized protein n=1 Tax=marine sediment metagenome TaxID=412755 RepID=X1TSV8_9ZZZZ